MHGGIGQSIVADEHRIGIALSIVTSTPFYSPCFLYALLFHCIPTASTKSCQSILFDMVSFWVVSGLAVMACWTVDVCWKACLVACIGLELIGRLG